MIERICFINMPVHRCIMKLLYKLEDRLSWVPLRKGKESHARQSSSGLKLNIAFHDCALPSITMIILCQLDQRKFIVFTLNNCSSFTNHSPFITDWGDNHFSRNPNTLKCQVQECEYILDNWNGNKFFPRFDGIGTYLYFGANGIWNLIITRNMNIFPFSPRNPSLNRPLGEMVIFPNRLPLQP